jgi:hypothetical protein
MAKFIMRAVFPNARAAKRQLGDFTQTKANIPAFDAQMIELSRGAYDLEA